MTNTASQKQIDFIKSLQAQRVWVEIPTGLSADESLALAESSDKVEYEAGVAVMFGRRLWELGQFDTKAASVVIDVLKKAPYKSGRTEGGNADFVVATETPEGMHKFGGVFYKVQRAVHGSGHLYAKVLVEDPSSKSGWSFEYASGAIRNLSEATRLPLDEAKKFGVLYGVCSCCGRTLTDEESIAKGIGPVCEGKYF